MKGSMIVWKSGTGIGISLLCCSDRLGRLHNAALCGLGADSIRLISRSQQVISDRYNAIRDAMDRFFR
jgi:hypothetical protein